jgi:osmoprotectant transport system permease protein
MRARRLAVVVAAGPCVLMSVSDAVGIIRIGSKKFTESVILGEAVTQLLGTSGFDVSHERQLGGTRILWNALLAGEIDCYPEYTGTITQELLAGEVLGDQESLSAALADLGIAISRPLGFNNTYALGMQREVASRLGIETISDLVEHPKLTLGFTNEFMDREDGWPSLRVRYGLPHKGVRGLDHDLAYRGLVAGTIHVTDLYSTDAEIRYYDLKVLEDDLQHFPRYDAVLLYRADLATRHPEAVRALLQLEGRISEDIMVEMNAAAKADKVPETRIAAGFLASAMGIRVQVDEETIVGRLLRHTGEHLFLVGVSLAAAIVLAVPLGVIAAKHQGLGQSILGVVGVIQTIPSLALLVFMIPLFGIGGPPAVVALFLYSLLPIVRNTHAGLRDIPVGIRESAVALGLPAAARLRLVEFPMASPSVLAGIKTSAVINVGTATLGALIGAGGYGQPILTGIRLDDVSLILQGAVPAALLAVAVQAVFELAERVLVPRGLRLPRSP